LDKSGSYGLFGQALVFLLPAIVMPSAARDSYSENVCREYGSLAALGMTVSGGVYSFTFRNRSEFVITDTELKLIAAAARIGLSSSPNTG